MLIVEIVQKSYEIDPKAWFKYVADPEIIMGDFEKRIIQEVGRCEVVGPNLIISEVLGAIPPESMGGGLLAVLAMKYADYREYGRVDLSQVGKNMIPYIQEVARNQDIHVTTSIYFPYISNGNYLLVENSNKVCSSNLEFYREIDKVLR